MSLIIQLLPEKDDHLEFSSFSRTLTWRLSDTMDLFVQILVLQLLTVNYFKPNYDLNKLPTLLGGKNIVSIYGRQAYNPFYHKKALFNINEEVLKKLNLEHDRLKITRKCLYSEAF